MYETLALRGAPARLLLALFFAAAGACGDDDGGGSTDLGAMDAGGMRDAGMRDAGDGDAGSDDMGVERDAVFAVAGGTFTPEGVLGYVAVVPNIDAGLEVDLEDALVFAGNGFIQPGPNLDGRFYVIVNERPVIERYVVDDEGTITLDDEVGFAGFGITTLSARNPMHFLDDGRAYLVDVGTRQVVIWDPEEMTVSDSFSIDGLEREGLTAGSNNIVRDGDRLVLSLRYFRPDMSAATVTTAVIIDTTDDSVTYAEDTRCGNIAGHIVAGTGDLYFSSHTSQAARIRAGEAGDDPSVPCLLRMRAGADDFDGDFFVELNALTGDSPTGFLIPGAGNTAYVLAYNEEIVPITDQPSAVLTQTGAWEYWAVDLGGAVDTATKVPGFPASSAFGFAFLLEGTEGVTPYIISIGDGFATSTLYDVSDPGEFVEGATVPGLSLGAFRLR
ncbi:MAG: hypothetical protein AAGH15_00535 [Myxococcota bacterium]